MPAVTWCILAVNCTCANNALLRSFEYQNGWLWRWHARAHPFRAREQKKKKKGQKDERGLELKAPGPALNITHSKHPGVWKNSASVNSAIKMVTVFGSPSFSSQGENLGIIVHWVKTATSIFLFEFWILVWFETADVSVSKMHWLC